MTRWPAPATTRSCSCFVLGDAGRCSALRGARSPGAPRLARGLSDLASAGRARPACYDVGRARRSVADVRLGLGLVVVAAGPGSYDEFAGAGDRAAGRAEPGGIDVGAALGVGEHPAPSGRGPRLASDPREHAPTRPVNVEQVILGRCFDVVNKLALLRLKRRTQLSSSIEEQVDSHQPFSEPSTSPGPLCRNCAAIAYVRWAVKVVPRPVVGPRCARVGVAHGRLARPAAARRLRAVRWRRNAASCGGLILAAAGMPARRSRPQ
jgi:hypothetical protein